MKLECMAINKTSENINVKRRVSIMPVMQLRNFFKFSRGKHIDFGNDHITYWFNGRAAIWQGIKALGLKKGDRIITPAYSCGAELDVLLKTGVKLDYYRIDNKLNADLAHIEELCQSPASALFVTHYYGQPQPMDALKKIADKYNLLLIEDASHALFSNTDKDEPLGQLSDMAIFSLWKSLEIPDGGVLRLRTSVIKEYASLTGERPSMLSIAGRLRYMFEESLSISYPLLAKYLKSIITEPFIMMVDKLRGKKELQLEATSMTTSNVEVIAESSEVAFRLERGRWLMSGFSRYLLPRILSDDLAKKRYCHFMSLSQKIKDRNDVRLLIHDIKDTTCPLFFPVTVTEPRAFSKYLAENGVGFFRAWCVFHPDVDWDKFPLESHLKENVVVLPVHQSLVDSDIDYIANVVNAWNVDCTVIKQGDEKFQSQ